MTLSGDHISPASPLKSHVSSPTTSIGVALQQKEMPLRTTPTGIVAVGKGSEMLNILINDSFSTNHSKKTGGTRKGGKKKLASRTREHSAQQTGYSALEILQMKDA